MNFLKTTSLLFALMVMTVLVSPSDARAFDHSHAKWDSILKKYVKNGKVGYASLTRDQNILKAYLADLEGVQKAKYDKWSKNNQKAFLINAYNAFTVKLILKHYPVKSIKDIGSVFTKPWDVKFFKLFQGRIQSLDPIEHKWLRPKFKDYRIHAAVNCASYSCPVLRSEAYTGANLDNQLTEQMYIWLADPSKNIYDSKRRTIYISKLFDWYESDFNKWGGGVRKVLQTYAPESVEQLVGSAKIEYMDYKWHLNGR